ncbi:PaREP1 family protein [Sulfolobus tengchongensis]|uniref:PaREP1 family protein n=1 Tax=Sulfolobus tengchongensis TaxID=207809 RepID=A0AAX4L155_9CREN
MSGSQIRSQILNWIIEADELLSKGDVVQASEKYYKAAEEALKLIAVKLNMTDILEKVKKRRRWDSVYLFEVAKRVSLEVWEIWLSSWTLHVYGFHEMKLKIQDVKEKGNKVKNIVYFINRL